MKQLIMILFASLWVVGCGSRPRSGEGETTTLSVAPKEYTYRVEAIHPHSTDNYTQGLELHEGLLWEGTGQHGESRLVRYRLGDKQYEEVARLPRSEFGEGITILQGELFQLTWMNNTAHIYDPTSGKELRKVRYTGEGWGLTNDGKQLILSDGSSTLYRLNPQTFSRERAIPVTWEGEPLEMLNELEWIEGRIWANIYMTDYIAIIHPETGVVEGMIDCRGLLPQEERTPETDVLNGIAYDSTTGHIILTGKNWKYLYEITIHEK